MPTRLTWFYLGVCTFLVVVFPVTPDGAASSAPPKSGEIDTHVGDASSRDQANKRAPRVREYQLAIGTILTAKLRTPVGSASASIDDQVDATLSEAVTQDGVELIPAGSVLHGRIVGVVLASRKGVRGQVTLSFAVVQHAVTQSRAAMRTQPISFEAQPPEATAGAGRRSRKQPVDLALPAGHPLLLTLADPLLVFIPE